MEIHGSSLNFSALRTEPQKVERKTGDAFKRHEQRSGTSEQRQQSETPAAIEKKLSQTGLTPLPHLSAAGTAADLRKLNAINAYVSQSNQPLLEQRAQRVAGIDLYV